MLEINLSQLHDPEELGDAFQAFRESKAHQFLFGAEPQ